MLFLYKILLDSSPLRAYIYKVFPQKSQLYSELCMKKPRRNILRGCVIGLLAKDFIELDPYILVNIVKEMVIFIREENNFARGVYEDEGWNAVDFIDV